MTRISSPTRTRLTGIVTIALFNSTPGAKVAGSGKAMLNNPELAYNFGKDMKWLDVLIPTQQSLTSTALFVAPQTIPLF